MKKAVTLGLLSLITLSACQSPTQESDLSSTFLEKPIVAYELQTSILKIYEDGSTAPTGFTTTSEGWPEYFVSPWLIPAPNREKLAYTVWDLERNGIVIYVSRLDGTESKGIAIQEIPEGNGELLVNTLTWVNDETIRYQEKDLFNELKTYEVNVNSGRKVLVANP